MTNRILDVVVLDHRLDPVETELRIHVKTEHLDAGTEIRGRLRGPHCAYASTVEIAFPVRELGRAGHFELRAVIPEPSLWDPESPFLYEGTLELWEGGAACDRITFRHGIRRVQLTSRGLRFNGKPFGLRGKCVEPTLSEVEARTLHDAGYNTLLTKVSETGLGLWELADRIGFCVLGTSDHLARFVEHRADLTTHPSALGWIFNRVDFSAGPAQESDRPLWFGINSSAQINAANADFLCCHEDELGWLEGDETPKIIVTRRLANLLPVCTGAIGWIEAS